MRPSLRIVLIITGLLCVGPLFAAETGLLEEGDRLLSQNRLDDALVAWDSFKQQHPDRLEPYLRTAQALIAAGRLHDASAELKVALPRRSSSLSDTVELARAVAGVGNIGIAAGVLEAAQKAAPLDLDATWLLADLYYQQRRFDEALAVLDRYRSLPGAAAEKEDLRRGVILLEKGALEDAMTAFEAVVQGNPEQAAGFHGLSKVCQYGNNPEAALKMSREAVRLEPDNGIYLFQLGVVLKSVGQNEEAIRRLEEAEAKGADAFGISFELGDAFRRTGQTQQAREALARYQSLLEKRRLRQEELQLVSESSEELEQGDMSGALDTLSRLAERVPENWTAHEQLAKIRISSGDLPRAWPHIQKMLELDPESSEAHFLAAIHAAAGGDVQEALRQALEARRLRPGNPPLRNLLGNLYFQRREWKPAVEEYGAAAALDPDNAAFRANLESARKRLPGGP